MRTIKIMAGVLAVVMVAALFVGCNQTAEQQKKIGPEVGQWHAEIRISDYSDSMAEEDRFLLAMLAGDIMLEVEAEFYENGAFTYVMNTDKLQKAISDSLSTVIGYFIGFDVSLFTERLVEAAILDTFQGTKREYDGVYSTSESGIITAQDEGVLNFRMKGNSLIQLDSEGNDSLRFTRVSQ